MKSTNLSILICSCDRYADVWPPFFYFFNKHWEDCPYPLYLLTNEKEYSGSGVTTLPAGEDNDWSSGFLHAVEQVGTKYILILMEDYFLLEKPDCKFFNRAVESMRENKVSYLRLFPRPGPDDVSTRIGDVEIGEIFRNSEYRVSLQAAIWDVDYLKRLVRVGESAWELEVKGTERSNDMPDKLYSVADGAACPISYFCTAVVKGYWVKEAVAMCRQNNVEIDLSKRKIEPFYVRGNIRPIIELVELKNKLLERLKLSSK